MIVEYEAGGTSRRLRAIGLELDEALTMLPDGAQLLGVTWI